MSEGTEINMPSEQAPESQEYIDRMVAVAEAGEAPSTTPEAPSTTPQEEQKPAWLGEFESPEALAKAYAELRTKMSREGSPKETAPAETPTTRDEAAKVAEGAGVDMAALETEFLEHGGLTDATYENLAKAGFARETVDAYIAGQQALNEQIQSRIEEHVGGADRLQAALEWAATGLSQEEAQAFNNAVTKADEVGLKFLMDGLMAKYTAAEGNEPRLHGGSVSGSSGSVFRSTAELTAAMGDPRYQRDEAYRADVMARLARSSIF